MFITNAVLAVSKILKPTEMQTENVQWHTRTLKVNK